jgi:DNA repair protein RecN (Recombination protein N)
MLDEITASNLGLIAEAVLAPGPGLTVITGETGTGKTLMLGALRLVRGEVASKGTIGPHAEATDVAARFLGHNDTEMIVRRVVTRKRSRAYIDGVPATASELATAIGTRVSIVGQHDQHTLGTSDGVRAMIDSMFTDDDHKVGEAYRLAYESLASIEAEMELLGSDRRGIERELEMARFQVAEIAGAGFSNGEEEELRRRLERLRHAEEIAEDLSIATDAIAGDQMESLFQSGLTALGRVARLDGEASDLEQRLSQIAANMAELSVDLTRYADGIESDPAVLSTDEQRLAELSGLKRKYGDTIPDITTFATAASARIDVLESMINAAETLEARHNEAAEVLHDSTIDLRQVRQRHARVAGDSARTHLESLGFDRPVVRIDIDPKPPTITGADRFIVMFASDASLTVAPISAVASGGELSRLVLALTLACGAADTEVVAFDEIDAGIGGSTALAMGEKLAALALTRQVICVTHLPQVAAYAAHHFTVDRQGTVATVASIDGEARVREISRMLAGLEGSDKAIQHAEELLQRAGVRKLSEDET